MRIVLSYIIGLLLSANIPVAAETPVRYDITMFGAVGDSKTMNTLFIQNAIDECSKKGGGVVVVPQGKFISGAIFLKQGVNLFVKKDGVLKGSVSQADYLQINTRWEGEERIWTSALINIIDVNNVAKRSGFLILISATRQSGVSIFSIATMLVLII